MISEMYDEKIYKNKDLEIADKEKMVETVLKSQKIFSVYDLISGDIQEYNEDELSHSYYALWTGTEALKKENN